MYRRIQIILKMFIPVHVLKLSKENGEHSLFLCLSKDEKTFLNGTLNIKYEKKKFKSKCCMSVPCFPSQEDHWISSCVYMHSPKSVDFRGKGKAR